MAYTDDWESLMNGVFGPGGRFKAAPGTSAPKTGGSAALPDLNAALLEQQKRLDELLKQQNAQLRTQSDATTARTMCPGPRPPPRWKAAARCCGTWRTKACWPGAPPT